jgi:outer membrane translocation and assembly module TamA
VRAGAGTSTRREGGRWIDNTASATLRAVTPTYLYARLVALLTVATRWNDVSNQSFTIGSDDGLRGFSINEFSGQRLARGNLEIRSIPLPIWVFRVGGVLFYDVGGAEDTFKTMRLHHDVGIGFRMLIPQTSRELFRFDLALALDNGTRTARGDLAFIAGFESAF